MNHQGCFLTGFLAGQRLKRWQLGTVSGAAGGPDFYDWAAGAGAPEELRSPEAYARFIAGLPPHIRLNSDGTLTWTPTIDDAAAEYPLLVHTGGMRIATGGTAYYFTSRLNAQNNFTIDGFYTPNSDRRSWTVLGRSDGFNGVGISCFRYVAPVDGTYCMNGGVSLKGFANYRNGTVAPIELHYPDESSPNSGSAAFIGGTYSLPRNMSSYWYQGSEVPNLESFAFNGGGNCVLCDFTIYLPVFIIRPYSTFYQFSIARPGELPGSPVDETARTFANPLTGQIISFVGFLYDYQTRRYALTLPDDGGTIAVTFGDSTLTITDASGETAQALYPENAGGPVAAPDGAFDKTAFLSGLAAGLASRGWSR